jgi:putative transposase
LLRSAGSGPMTKSVARRLAKHLGVHSATIYRWRNRLLASDRIESMEGRKRGVAKRQPRLGSAQQDVLSRVIAQRLRHHRLKRLVELTEEVAVQCAQAGIAAPHRSTIARHCQRALHDLAAERPAPGHYRIQHALDVVQIDHTVCDVIVVDELYRAPIGRPYLTVALDVASRCVLAALVSFTPPSAATVALCLCRIAAPKDEWIGSLGLKCAWPMYGLPRSLHMDNAPEFHS